MRVTVLTLGVEAAEVSGYHLTCCCYEYGKGGARSETRYGPMTRAELEELVLALVDTRRPGCDWNEFYSQGALFPG